MFGLPCFVGEQRGSRIGTILGKFSKKKMVAAGLRFQRVMDVEVRILKVLF